MGAWKFTSVGGARTSQSWERHALLGKSSDADAGAYCATVWWDVDAWRSKVVASRWGHHVTIAGPDTQDHWAAMRRVDTYILLLGAMLGREPPDIDRITFYLEEM